MSERLMVFARCACEDLINTDVTLLFVLRSAFAVSAFCCSLYHAMLINAQLRSEDFAS